MAYPAYYLVNQKGEIELKANGSNKPAFEMRLIRFKATAENL